MKMIQQAKQEFPDLDVNLQKNKAREKYNEKYPNDQQEMLEVKKQEEEDKEITEEQSPTITPDKDGNIIMNRGDLEALIKETVRKTEDATKNKDIAGLTTMVDDIISTADRISTNKLSKNAPAGTIPESDILDEPVYFWTPYQSYAIMGYALFGREMLPPYNIYIDFINESVSISGKSVLAKEVHQISVAKIMYQPQVDYIRNHPKFGVEIFERYSDTMEVDKERVSITRDISNAVYNMSQTELIRSCKFYSEIKITPDHNEMARQLIQLRVEGALKENKRGQASEKIVKDSAKAQNEYAH
jgi:hypothetical protein